MRISINKDILKLAIPSILANITVPIVGMVDIAVAGHLDSNAATMIGGIAIGSMLFDLLYWNFGFLRVGTGGLAAQAFGRGDRKECARILVRAVGIALACALVLIAVQWLFVKAAFLVVDCTPEVRQLASQYLGCPGYTGPYGIQGLVHRNAGQCQPDDYRSYCQRNECAYELHTCFGNRVL